MATQEKTWNVANRLHSLKDSDNPEVNHIIAGADEIYDDTKGVKQSEHNAQTDDRLNEVETDLNAPTVGINDRVHTLEEQVAFEGDIEVENAPHGIISGSGKVTSANAVRGAIDVRTGYFVCESSAPIAAKTINASGFVLTPGGSIKVLMQNANTANDATLNISSTGAKPLYYAEERASANNSWEAGEVVEVFYDGTNFYANNVAGGSGSGDGAFDISAKTGQNYETLSAALTAANSILSASKKKGGMSIKFIQLTPAKYTVVKTEGATEQPTGTELQSDPGIISGTYEASQLSAFSTLPTTLNSSLTYYLAVTETVDEQEVTTYTSWVITYAQSSDNKYVQYRCMAQNFTTDVTQWQGVDEEPIPGSHNLMESGGCTKIFNSLLPQNYIEDVSELYIEDLPEGNVTLRAKNTIAIIISGGVKGECTPTENNKVYEFKVSTTNDSTRYPVGKVVGYILFRDYSNFLSKESSSNSGNIKRDYCENVANSPLIAACIGEIKINSIAATNATNVVSSYIEHASFVKELYLYGTGIDTSKTYSIAIVSRNHSTQKYSVQIKQGDTIVAQSLKNETRPQNPVLIKEYQSSGVNAYAILNWDEFDDGTLNSVNILFTDRVFDINYSPIIKEYLEIQNLQSQIQGILPQVQDVSMIKEAVIDIVELSNSDLVMGRVQTNGILGTYTEEKGYWRTGHIDCKGGIKISLGDMAHNPYVSSYAIYDSTYNMLINSVNVQADFEIDLTQVEGAAYIALTVTTQAKTAGSWTCKIYKSKVNEDEDVKQDIEILIPDKVYAIVGTELNIWYDTVALSVDRGLLSPMNYSVMFICNKGFVTDRCFRFTPQVGDVGDVPCTAHLFDVSGKRVESKTFTIKVVSKSAVNAPKKIIYFGDSLGDDVAKKLYANFNDSNRFSGIIPQMLGTQGTTINYEAVGGYSWAAYATASVAHYRISVSGVTSMSEGAVYSDGAHTFSVAEVNIVDGTGNCLLKRYGSGASVGDLIVPSGTLTKVSGGGDSSVPYTGAYKESANPLWNSSSSQLDLDYYKQQLISMGQLSSLSDKIDAVSFQFGVNDNALASDLTLLHTYISDLYNLFIGDNENCKFIVGLTTSPSNDANGSGANYGATKDYKQYLENINTIRKYYLTLLSEFPNMRIATPNLYLDRYYGYGFSSRPISNRYSETEQYHSNYYHPTTSGYEQMADGYLAAYSAILSE